MLNRATKITEFTFLSILHRLEPSPRCLKQRIVLRGFQRGSKHLRCRCCAPLWPAWPRARLGRTSAPRSSSAARSRREAPRTPASLAPTVRQTETLLLRVNGDSTFEKGSVEKTALSNTLILFHLSWSTRVPAKKSSRTQGVRLRKPKLSHRTGHDKQANKTKLQNHEHSSTVLHSLNGEDLPCGAQGRCFRRAR